ncbi:MAG: hypothetical protein WBS19_07590 [Candidatus Korobacteraceae bacterium]
MSDDLKAKALESLSDTRNRLMVEVANVELPPDQREFLQNMFRDLHIYQVKLVAIDPGSLTTTARSRLQNLVDLLNCYGPANPTCTVSGNPQDLLRNLGQVRDSLGAFFAGTHGSGDGEP